MPIRARKNLYCGINAHLNSFLQNTTGEWESFHAAHIVDITRTLNQQLPSGYEARVEKSLQIREIYLSETGIQERHRRPQPDVTILETERNHPRSSSTASMTGTAEILSPVIDTMDIDTESLLNATVIYQIAENDLMGKPVCRIELLSPVNKPPSDGYKQYREKRNSTLNSGMPLIEMDYLHQSSPVVKNLPAYPLQEQGAHPYVIIVSDPRPSIQTGLSHLYVFDVDDPIPLIDIPLANNDRVEQFNLGVAYQVTFENTPTYMRIVDYAEPPLHMMGYHPDDQARILRRMQHILEAHQNGVNLDQYIPE